MIILNCPYCKVVLPKVPQRKTKCKKCGGYYYKRTYPPDVNGEEFIVTEKEAKRIDAAWLEYNTRHNRFVLGDTIEDPSTELELELYKIEQLMKHAQLLGGKIMLGEKAFTLEQLQDFREDLKSQIAAEKSQRKLRIIK